MKKLRKRIPVIQVNTYSMIYKLLKERNVDAVYEFINEKSVDEMNDIKDRDSLSDDLYLREWNCRRYFTHIMSWAIPSKKIVQEILDFAGGEIILEIGGGRGLWGGLLKATSDNPNQIIVTDNFEWKYGNTGERFTDIVEMSAAEALESFPEAGVLMSVWPAGYGPRFTLDNFKGNKLVYIGEEYGGCTHFEGLFEEKFERDWELVKKVDIYNWFNFFLNDSLYLYRRRD